jgi:hypothetical protein
MFFELILVYNQFEKVSNLNLIFLRRSPNSKLESALAYSHIAFKWDSLGLWYSNSGLCHSAVPSPMQDMTGLLVLFLPMVATLRIYLSISISCLASIQSIQMIQWRLDKIKMYELECFHSELLVNLLTFPLQAIYPIQ